MKKRINSLLFCVVLSIFFVVFWFFGKINLSVYFLFGLLIGFALFRYLEKDLCFWGVIKFLPYPIILEKNNKIEYINLRFIENFGYSPEDLKGEYIQKIFVDKNKFKEFFEDKDKGKFHIIDLVCKNGSFRKIIFRQALINNNRLIFLEDMSDCSEDSERLRISEEKFAKAFRVSPDAITISNLKDGRYIEVNKKFTEVIGYSQEETIGKTSLDLKIWAKPEEREQMVKIFKKQGYVYDFEFTFGTKSGKTGIALMSVEPIVINGETCLLIVSRDITERKKMEQALIDSEKNLKIEVKKRTKELEEKMVELEKLNEFMIGRELKINELKKEIEGLKESE